MVTLHAGKHYILNNQRIASLDEAAGISQDEARKQTMTYQVLKAHNHWDNMEHLEIRFDSMGVYDNTYVGILQTAYASGFKEFPTPATVPRVPCPSGKEYRSWPRPCWGNITRSTTRRSSACF